MDTKKTTYFLKTLHRSLNIPIVYGTYGNDLKFFQPFKLITENNPDFITARLLHVIKRFPNEHILYLLNPNMVMLGMIFNHTTEEFVLVGPLATASAKEQDVANYLFEAGLSAETTKKVAAYLNSSKPLTTEGLKNLLVSINTVINDETLSINEITAIFDDATVEKVKFAEVDFNHMADAQNQINTEAIEEYNRKLNFCVANGDLDGLSDLLNNMAESNYREYASPSFAEMKISTFGSVFATEAIALKSGIPASDCERIKQYYLQRINNATDREDLRKMSVNALYEFTKSVKDYLSQKTSNPTINRAINYIKSNISTKMLADDIAQALHINPHYLFTKFKQETGMTLTEFINREKVQRACYYLTFTDKSLIDISVFLSFSSQSYFQTVFKKIMGQTPNEYRKNFTYV